jgi:hypothetical protein
VTIWLVAQCLNHYATTCPPNPATFTVNLALVMRIFKFFSIYSCLGISVYNVVVVHMIMITVEVACDCHRKY